MARMPLWLECPEVRQLATATSCQRRIGHHHGIPVIAADGAGVESSFGKPRGPRLARYYDTFTSDSPVVAHRTTTDQLASSSIAATTAQCTLGMHKPVRLGRNNAKRRNDDLPLGTARPS